MEAPEPSSPTIDRRRAVLAVLVLVVLGGINVAQLFVWGVNPLWAFVIVPPILFFLVLAWFAFRRDLVHESKGGR